jgi:hypothetical protein
MKKHTRLLGVGAAALVGAMGFLTDGNAAGDKGPKAAVPEPAFNQLVKESAKVIQDGLDGKPDDKLTLRRVRTNAFVVAAAAQDQMGKAGADGKQLAALRDAALKLYEAAGEKKDLAEAKKQAGVIAQYPGVKAEPGAGPGKVALKDRVDEIDEVMNVFAKKDKGGDEIEKELITLGGQKKPLTPAQMSDKLVLNAYKAALVGQLLPEYNAIAKNKAKDWDTWSADMQKAALELAETVKGKNAKEVKTAINKLNSSCNACHSVFRD